MTRCPTCRRRHHRPRRRPTAPPAPLPLFEHANRRARTEAARARAVAPEPRVILMHGCSDADGQPRAAVQIPGRPTPTVYPTIAAATRAAQQYMEAAAR